MRWVVIFLVAVLLFSILAIYFEFKSQELSPVAAKRSGDINFNPTKEQRKAIAYDSYSMYSTNLAIGAFILFVIIVIIKKRQKPH
ncbi:hypothetical protein M0R36_09580 [bacterium]|nr:hypothetical protein [bacterium]